MAQRHNSIHIAVDLVLNDATESYARLTLFTPPRLVPSKGRLCLIQNPAPQIRVQCPIKVEWAFHGPETHLSGKKDIWCMRGMIKAVKASHPQVCLPTVCFLTNVQGGVRSFQALLLCRRVAACSSEGESEPCRARVKYPGPSEVYPPQAPARVTALGA